MESDNKFKTKDCVNTYLNSKNISVFKHSHEKAVKAEHAKTLNLPDKHQYPKLISAEIKDGAKYFILLDPVSF